MAGGSGHAVFLSKETWMARGITQVESTIELLSWCSHVERFKEGGERGRERDSGRWRERLERGLVMKISTNKKLILVTTFIQECAYTRLYDVKTLNTDSAESWIISWVCCFVSIATLNHVPKMVHITTTFSRAGSIKIICIVIR